MQKKQPTVSIVSPAYNAERFIKAMIDSVLEQTMVDWELLIVIDRHSSDRTAAIAKAYSTRDSRIRTVDTGTAGVAANRNCGSAIASGRYLCFLDSDDFWLPRKLEAQVEFMHGDGVGWSCTGYSCLSEDGRTRLSYIYPDAISTYKKTLRWNGIGCLTTMFDRNVVKNIEFREEQHEDYALWLRLLKAGHIAYGLRKELACYRRVGKSRSNDKLLSAKWRWQIYRNQEGMGRWGAALHSAAYIYNIFRHRKRPAIKERTFE